MPGGVFFWDTLIKFPERELYLLLVYAQQVSVEWGTNSTDLRAGNPRERFKAEKNWTKLPASTDKPYSVLNGGKVWSSDS